ncbi:hypothetical protein lerEdw1_016872 [Lerista edwardsae]|nr:hypothetical protein lerEdw1_016872 [Lerista edwardsae]
MTDPGCSFVLVGAVQRRYDPNGGLQYEEDHQGKCHYKGDLEFLIPISPQLWDIGGQPRFRSMWERYCRGVSAIVYMVDAADQEKIEASKNELHNLLDKPQLQGIPVLVLGNKRDLPGALDEKELIEKMNLSAIQDREICCYSISCKEKDNIAIMLLLNGACELSRGQRLMNGLESTKHSIGNVMSSCRAVGTLLGWSVALDSALPARVFLSFHLKHLPSLCVGSECVPLVSVPPEAAQ